VPILGGGLCGLAARFGTSCEGLRLVNPGLGDALAPGSLVNVPPCTFNG
jgi:hypothetical protein